MILEYATLNVSTRQDWNTLPDRLQLERHGEETSVDGKREAAIEAAHR